MADIFKIQLPNGDDYKIKDAEARDAVSRTLNKVKTVILIGDSYGIDTEWWTGWQSAFTTINAHFIYKSAVGGSGLIGDPNVQTFLQQLQTLSSSITKKNEVTDIVFMGGYNDVSLSYSEAQLLTAMGQLTAYCRGDYPFAKIHFGYIAINYRTSSTQATIRAYDPVFKRICTKFMVHYIPNARYVLMNRSYIFLDESNANWGFHPNTNGGKALAEFLVAYLASGYVDVTYNEDITSFGHVDFKNGDIVIHLGNNLQRYPFISELTAKEYANDTWYDLLDMKTKESNLIWGPYNLDYVCSFHVLIEDLVSGVFNIVGNGMLRLYRKKFQFKFIDRAHTLTANSYMLLQSPLYIPERANFT